MQFVLKKKKKKKEEMMISRFTNVLKEICSTGFSMSMEQNSRTIIFVNITKFVVTCI